MISINVIKFNQSEHPYLKKVFSILQIVNIFIKNFVSYEYFSARKKNDLTYLNL